MKFEKDSPEWKIYMGAYRFHQKYRDDTRIYSPEDVVHLISSMANEITEQIEPYKKDKLQYRFAKAVYMAAVNDIGDRIDERTKNERF